MNIRLGLGPRPDEREAVRLALSPDNLPPRARPRRARLGLGSDLGLGLRSASGVGVRVRPTARLPWRAC